MNKQLALVFPGQGSQSIGMLTLWADDPLFRSVVQEASDAIDIDLWQLAQHGPAERLTDTRLTQPLMVAAGLASWYAWREMGGAVPEVCAGHSVGEITALGAAQALDLRQATHLVRHRALAMAEAVPAGTAGMAAVLGLQDSTVESLCAACAQSEVLEPVNYNAPGQVVVAGHLTAIERLKPAAREAGAKMVFVLQVSGPFHSSLMKPAAQALRRYLETLAVREPQFQVLHNCDLSVACATSIKPALVAHLTRPVDWVRTVQAMAALGVTHVVELGPGEVLTNLCKRIAPELTVTAANSPASMAAACDAVMSSR